MCQSEGVMPYKCLVLTVPSEDYRISTKEVHIWVVSPPTIFNQAINPSNKSSIRYIFKLTTDVSNEGERHIGVIIK